MARYNFPVGSGGAAQVMGGKGRKASPAQRGGGRVQPEEQEMQGGDDHHAAIHEHLAQMHAATGHAHTHIEHHGDGTHTSHHIDEGGNISGPHEHGSTEELTNHIASTAGDGEQAGEGEDDSEGY
jgi:hypothetical protein